MTLCDSEEFSLDASWLSQEARTTPPLADELVAQEKEMIEAAVAETRGRVSRPSGAATKIRIPASTLDSKIKSLRSTSAASRWLNTTVCAARAW